MNSLGELLGKEIVTRIAAEYVKIGSVYKMPMTEANRRGFSRYDC